VNGDFVNPIYVKYAKLALQIPTQKKAYFFLNRNDASLLISTYKNKKRSRISSDETHEICVFFKEKFLDF
jgi:hypothetical protein